MLSIQTDYSTLTAVLGRRAPSHCEALSSVCLHILVEHHTEFPTLPSSENSAHTVWSRIDA